MKGNIQVCKYLHCLTTSCQTSRLVFLSADFLSLCPAHWGTIHLNVSDTWVHSKCMLWGIYTAESLPRWHNLESKIDCFRWHFHLWLIGLMLHFSLIFLSFFLSLLIYGKNHHQMFYVHISWNSIPCHIENLLCLKYYCIFGNNFLIATKQVRLYWLQYIFRQQW